MANTSEGGFRFKFMRNGARMPPVELRVVADGYATGIFKGDCVKLVSDGTIAACAASDNVYGVVDGVEQYYDGSVVRRGNYLPASTAWGTVEARRSTVRVIPAIDAVFEVDSSAATATTEANWRALVNENCDIVATAGSTANGLSGHNLDTSTHNTTSKQFRIVGLSTRPDNDFTASRCKLLVEVNASDEPQFTTTGI